MQKQIRLMAELAEETDETRSAELLRELLLLDQLIQKRDLLDSGIFPLALSVAIKWGASREKLFFTRCGPTRGVDAVGPATLSIECAT